MHGPARSFGPLVRSLLGVSLSAALILAAGCQRSDDAPPALSLVRTFDEASVSGSPERAPESAELILGFDDEATIEPPEDAGELRGWKALHDVEGLELRDGRLSGRVTGEDAVIYVSIPEDALPEDLLGAVEVDLSVDAGTRLGIFVDRDPELDDEALADFVEYLDETEATADLVVDMEPGESKTVRLTDSDAPENRSIDLGSVRLLAIALFDAEGAEFSIEAVRLESRTQVLASIPAGFGWHGLADVYRETIVTRSPETVTWRLELGERPWFDVAVGGPEPHAATYRIEARAEGRDPITLERTVTTKDAWHPLELDLAPLAGRTIELALSVQTEDDGRVAFWGSPSIRHRGATPTVAAPTPARAALSEQGAPRGVILMLADTLRSDHLDAWGYERRQTAPTLTRLLEEGTRFDDNISQGTWTKIAVPAIHTSLYASTHGIVDVPDRLPASVTTLAEVFREGGYATFHTSSVLFSGRNSNLQQGVEVLHERASVRGQDDHPAKTAREYVRRLIDWLETHRDQPFFVFLHVFDPHSPFRPYEPWDRRWLDDEALAVHEEDLEKLDEHVEIFHGLPTADELAKAEVDADRFIEAEHAWYDASIRAMDVEIGRLFERLEEWGLADDVLFGFISDHGEEFLEHGRSWHGHSVYGEMINVPMALRWPGVVPAGLVVDRTTQSIDLMPTLLELARLPVPELAQGRSLVPLMAAPDDPAAYGGGRAPVFSERKDPPGETDEVAPDAYAVVLDGWKLIWNVLLRDDRPEFELFDHEADPLNLENLAADHPERVEQMKKLIEGWRTQAEAARVSDEGLEEELSPEEVRELKALGYIN